jgi:hypothetical protein
MRSIDPIAYVTDQEKFLREAENQPEWLQDLLRLGRSVSTLSIESDHPLGDLTFNIQNGLRSVPEKHSHNTDPVTGRPQVFEIQSVVDGRRQISAFTQ